MAAIVGQDVGREASRRRSRRRAIGARCGARRLGEAGEACGRGAERRRRSPRRRAPRCSAAAISALTRVVGAGQVERVGPRRRPRPSTHCTRGPEQRAVLAQARVGAVRDRQVRARLRARRELVARSRSRRRRARSRWSGCSDVTATTAGERREVGGLVAGDLDDPEVGVGRRRVRVPTAGPEVPADRAASAPRPRSRWPRIAVVVLLPFVPVTHDHAARVGLLQPQAEAAEDRDAARFQRRDLRPVAADPRALDDRTSQPRAPRGHPQPVATHARLGRSSSTTCTMLGAERGQPRQRRAALDAETPDADRARPRGQTRTSGGA